jgi:hypothetical protein
MKILALAARFWSWVKQSFHKERYIGKGGRDLMILADRDKLEIHFNSWWERKK